KNKSTSNPSVFLGGEKLTHMKQIFSIPQKTDGHKVQDFSCLQTLVSIIYLYGQKHDKKIHTTN
ncbi:MAG TPA: hypothetical protein PLG34_12845, partial [Spirochaetota bacterium]|nr:hypothetical protein [Spirochaetota bacterium]